jgi:hypothetical protein
MDVSRLLGIALVLLVVGVGIFISWERHDMAKAHIIGALKRIRARNISITFDWGDFDRDTFTYDVSFTTAAGRHHRDRCKVSTRLGAGEALYWERGLPSGE